MSESQPSRQEQLARAASMWRQALQKYGESQRLVMAGVIKAFEEYVRALKSAGLMDEEGKPVRRRDRPAWQSPYGPPKKRGN